MLPDNILVAYHIRQERLFVLFPRPGTAAIGAYLLLARMAAIDRICPNAVACAAHSGPLYRPDASLAVATAEVQLKPEAAMLALPPKEPSTASAKF
jgi:hypothetical protein